MWIWLDDTDGAVEEVKKVTVADPSSYEQTITYRFNLFELNCINYNDLCRTKKHLFEIVM